MNKEEFLKWLDEYEECEEKSLEEVKNDGYVLQYVQNQTPEICLEAVKKFGDALRYVRNQTPEICLKAVRNYRHALRYVRPEYLRYVLDNIDIEDYRFEDYVELRKDIFKMKELSKNKLILRKLEEIRDLLMK